MDTDFGQRILFEDNHLLAINKRCGELSQGDKTGDRCLVDDYKDFLRQRDAKPGQAFLGLVHRLDRPTSGALLLAKTSKALSRLNEQFKSRAVRKFYWAVVDAPLPDSQGELVHYLARREVANRSTAFDQPGQDRQEARLAYRMVGVSDRYYFVEIELLTGRHHQIRAQLAAVGVHIRGDLKYGARRSRPDGGIALHAAVLELPHPVGGQGVRLEADPRLVQADAVWQAWPAYQMPATT